LEGAQQCFGIYAIATVRLIGEERQFLLQKFSRTFSLAIADKMVGKSVCRAQGKSALTALAGES